MSMSYTFKMSFLRNERILGRVKSFSFSLIELLVVIAILAVLSSLLSPSLRKMMDQSISLQCKNNLMHTGGAVFLFSEDHDGWGLWAERLTSDTWDSFGFFDKVPRRWSDALEHLGYVPDHRERVLVGTSQLLPSAIDDPSNYQASYRRGGGVLSCPSVEGLDHTEAKTGWFNMATPKGYFQDTDTYGFRYRRNVSFGEKWYTEKGSESNNDNDSKITKLDFLRTDIPYLGDSIGWCKSHNKAKQSDKLFSYTQGMGPWQGYIKPRHGDQANVWFPDGRVDLWGYDNSMNVEKPYSNLGNPPLQAIILHFSDADVQ